MDLTLGAQSGQADRIEELDRQIAVSEKAITTVMSVTATQAAQMDLSSDRAAELVARAVKPMSAELNQLRKLRNEAVEWQQQTEAAQQRAWDLQALAERARTQMPDMDPEGQAEVIDLIDLKVTIQSPVTVRRGRSACAVGAWFKGCNQYIPA
ncbi:hypothetical protein [Streptomyces sp. NBC_00996]|uniref:hypothetical protein n=1 Tax=Streptomyces sp. NBC_00996 TaxID=2903710 RepID=UPI00386AE583|nr:hypothetical protein OG390_37875 [Streptomyces sp. NBC_00996]